MEYGNITMGKSFFVGDFQAEKSFTQPSTELFNIIPKVKNNTCLLLVRLNNLQN